MIEFAAGVLVSTYVYGVMYFIIDGKPYGRGVVPCLLWPLVLPVAPLTRRIFLVWKYNHRYPTPEEATRYLGDQYRKALFLREGRGPKDETKEMFLWLRKRILGR